MSCRKKPNTFAPTDEQRRLLLHDSVWYEMLYAFGVSPHKETDYCAWEHLNFSRMGHARTLYDFFETPTAERRSDDAISEDYGFPARAIERPANDRIRLNKQLFHLTYTRLKFNERSKRWPDTIISCLHDRCVEFIRHILSHKSEFGGGEDFLKWEHLLGALSSGRELHISRRFLSSGPSREQEISLGRQLTNRRGELTKPRPERNKKGLTNR
jgi:hypothetical protein